MFRSIIEFDIIPKRLAPRYRRDDTPGAVAPSAAAPPSTPPAASSPVAAPAGSAPAPAAAASSPASPTGDDIPDGDWKQLRTRYTEAKSRAAVLDTLGLDDTSTLPDIVKTYKAIHTEASGLARELGYEDADFKSAFAADPAKVLHLLRDEKAKAAAAPPLRQGETQIDDDKRISEEVKKQTEPFTRHINDQVSKQTFERVGTEIAASLKTSLPNAPAEVHDLVKDYVEEHLSHDTSALVAMKARGDFSAVDTAVKFVAGRLQQVFAKWVAAETARTGGRSSVPAAAPGTPGARPGKKMGYTIDELIEKPELLGTQYAAQG